MTIGKHYLKEFLQISSKYINRFKFLYEVLVSHLTSDISGSCNKVDICLHKHV